MKQRFNVFCLFLLSWLLFATGLCPAKAPAPRTSLKLQSINFYYRLDEAARFLELKTQWQSEHRGEVPMNAAAVLVQQAHQASDMDTPFSRWRYQGGPAPAILEAKAHLYTTGQKAMLRVPFSVTFRAKVGNWRVDPTLQLTDFEGLNRSAQWQMVSQRTLTVPAIASGEDVLLPLGEFELYRFLQKHPNQFPVALEVRVNNPMLGTITTTLPMIPDHFMTPSF